jgi:hypothetical protein
LYRILKETRAKVAGCWQRRNPLHSGPKFWGDSYLTNLNLLVGHQYEAHEFGDAEGCRHRYVGGVAAAPHDNAADAGMVVTRVHRVPAPSEKDFEPSAEIHWVDIDRNTDVAEIAGALAGGNVHSAAERDGEMSKVAAYADGFLHGIAGATG